MYTEKIEIVLDLVLSSLNITDLTGIEAFAALEVLNLDYNDLTTLDLSSNSNLRILDVAENDLTELDLSVIPTLEEIQLRSNKISNLILDNPNLKILRASKNPYTYLDVTKCPQLEELGVTQTLLATLDVRNGNNSIMTGFNAKFNDYLTCIEVDDATASYLSSWDKDATANFTEDCNTAVWSGTNGTDWTDNGNWSSNAVAATSQNVIIPVFVTSPVIASGVTAEMNDLEIQELSSFTVEDNGVVIVNGNFNTSETASIKSSSTTSGTLIVKGTSNGMVTFERSGLEANKWSIVTAPVSGQSIKEFIENATNDIRVNTTVTPNRYAIAYYDDSHADGSKWVYYTTDDLVTNTLTFEVGRGYAISRSTDGSVSFTGTLATSTATKSVVASQWNAVGNPFTAFLPLNENSGDNFVQDNSSNMDPAFVAAYVWDNTQSKYVANSLVSTENSLAPGQGFFIRMGSGASSITLDETQRLAQPSTGGTFTRGKQNQTPTIELIASSNNTSVTTVVKYFSNATKGLDPGYDVGNFGASSFDVFTHLLEGSNEDFTIQSLPNSDYESMVILVGVKLASNTTVSFKVISSGLPDGIEMYFEDREEGKIIKLKSSDEYSITSSAALNGTDRFYIHTISNKLSTNDLNSSFAEVKIYKSSKKQVVISGLITEAKVKIYSILGEELLSVKAHPNVENRISLLTNSTGIYIVKLASDLGNITKKIIVE